MIARRAQRWSVRALVVLAVAAAGVGLVALADRLPSIDVTATGAHQLSERTRAVLARATSDGATIELVIAADLARIDRRARERAGDVLDALTRAAPGVRTTTIDTASASGLDAYRALMARLQDRERDLLADHRTALGALGEQLAQTAAFAEQDLQQGLRRIGEGVGPDAPDAERFRAYFIDEQPVGARLLARDLRGFADTVTQESRAELPQLGTVRGALEQPLDNVDSQLVSLANILTRFAEVEGMSPPAVDAARGLIPLVRARRDALAVAVERVRTRPSSDLARVSRVLERAEAVLVIAPPRSGAQTGTQPGGLAAVDAGELFPPTAALDAIGIGGADLRRRAEELLATAIGTVTDPVRPIVVVTHAEPQTFLYRVPLMRALTERLGLRGIDVLEWACVLEPDPPSWTDLDPGAVRPVVFLTLSPDSSSASANNPELSGPRRAQTLGEATRRVLDSGYPLLASLNPSILPGYGEPDPVAAPMRELGIEAMTGRPLLSSSVSPSGPVVETDRVVVPEPEGEHPIAAGVGGLRTYLPWPIALDVRETPGVRTWALLTFPGDRWWGESSWLRVWQTPREQRRFMAQVPVFDEGRDERRASWTVAAAAERELVEERRHAGLQTQRVVVVGSNGWHIDPVTQQAAEVDGRVVAIYPGNLELLEAAVWWLAGRDDLIARSERARATPTVGAMSEGALRAWQLALLLGLPGAVLGFGVVWRLVRG